MRRRGEQPKRLRLAEQVVNAVMDAEADQLVPGGGANSLKRLPREVARHLRRHVDAAHPQAALRQLLPRGRARALPARRPRPRGRRGRDVRHGHEHPQGAEGGREDGRLQALEGPGERHRLELGRRYRGPMRKAARRLAGALRLARRDLRQVPPRGARRLHRRGHRHRLRCGRLEARPGRRRGRHRVLRLVARLPAGHPLARGGGRAARRLGRPPGARPGARRGLPGRRVAALRGPPHARLHARGRPPGSSGAAWAGSCRRCSAGATPPP